MKQLSLLVMFFLAFSGYSQNALFLKFPPKVGGQDLMLDSVVHDLNNRAMIIEDFNYYISNINVIHDGGQILDLSDTVILVKANAHTFFMGHHGITNVEQINFSVGVPPQLNHLDITQYPQGHFLSFQTPSMHWGWTAGYKFMLCDGKGDSNNDGIPDVIFQLHNLGDDNFKNVQLPVAATDYGTHIDLVIDCNIDEWIYGANPGTVGVQHGESGINASTMENVYTRNVFTQPGNVGNKELKKSGEVYFYSEDQAITFNWKDVTGIDGYRLIDLTGRVILDEQTKDVNGSVKMEELKKGNYLFVLMNREQKPIHSINVMH